MSRLKSTAALAKLRERIKGEVLVDGTLRVRACCGTACVASGAKGVVEAIENEAKERNMDVEVVKTGCQGL